MKHTFCTISFVVALCFSSHVMALDWSMSEGKLWSRQPEASVKSEEPRSDDSSSTVIRIEHSGEQNWAFSEGKHLPIRPGDMIRLNAVLELDGNGEASISVVTRRKNGQVVHWNYGNRGVSKTSPRTALESIFVIPNDIETIEPRLVGYGPAKVRFEGLTAKKVGFRDLSVSDTKSLVLQNDLLSVEVSEGVLFVTDKRTSRTWRSSVGMNHLVELSKPDEKTIVFRFFDTETLFEYVATWILEPDHPEIIVEIDGQCSMLGNVSYPSAFEPKSGDRLIVPINEGIGYPVEEKDIRVGRLVSYGGHGLCMAFWGHVDDATGSGMMGILETPDDAAIQFNRSNKNLLQVGVVWEPSVMKLRYPRKLRFVFFDQGGHVAVCKRYREYAKQIGLFRPFREKVKRNPNIDILLGAVNIWYRDTDAVAVAKEMKEFGFDRILWSGGGNAEEIVALNKMPNVLTSRIDNYQDVMSPEHFDKLHGNWKNDAWPNDINWTSPDGTWRKGWFVEQKDKMKPRIPCAVICDAKAVYYAQKRISKELETKPYTARFIDTTVASPWFECYHPNHPMTRSDSRKHRMELLQLIGEMGLVCGSETGHDASVPYCDYFEGMLSLVPYRVHDAGRDMIRKVEDVPPQVEHFMVNPALRLPLWELVYHDCVVAQWYWGDYNNKIPKVWRKRDLFNVLYGTPPMYMFNKTEWGEMKDRIAESYKTAIGTARATAYVEMTDHRFLSSDRMIQQTTFSNGVTVTVNFSDTPFMFPDGSKISSFDWKMKNDSPVQDKVIK